VFLPLILSLLATVSAAVMSYGTHPGWAQYHWGLGLIMTSRRLQWPLIALSLILCIALFALVISGKRRIWWLIGLAPVIALFGHRFMTSPINRLAILEDPPAVSVNDAAFLRDEDYVAGVVFNDQAYAYPLGCLYRSPIVLQSDREHRLMLMWSVRANAATGLSVAREVKARDLDIVSDPGAGLLVYSTRTGQFLSSITGETPHGEKWNGTETRVAVMKMTWKQWKTLEPETKVMSPVGGSYVASMAQPQPPERKDDLLVTIVCESKPIAVPSENIAAAPLNVSNGDVPAMVFRDETRARVIAFDRHIDKDLIPRFVLNTDPKRKAVFVDLDTNSGWSMNGVCVDGEKEMIGKKLARLPVQEDLYLSAAQFWYPGLKLDRSAKAQGADHAPTRPSLEDRKGAAGKKSKTNNPRQRRSTAKRP
jgi:hypothetical protein